MAQDPDEVTQRGEAVAATAAPPLTTDQIRLNIEETRAEMSGTIDAIQERLRPRRIITDAKDTVVDATVGRAKSLARTARQQASTLAERSSSASADVFQRVKDNPMPVVIAGLAAAGLMLRALGLRRSAQYKQLANRLEGRRPDRRGNGTPVRALAAASAGVACWAIRNGIAQPYRRGALQRPQDEDTI
jgi:hypothetical protein